MKTRLIGREKCEIYFMPYAGALPLRKEIRRYLKAHHPYFDSRSRVDCRRRTICGNFFLLLTVAGNASLNESKSLFPPRVSTASAILSLSSWAQKTCVIDCPGERITFGDAPISRLRTVGDGDKRTSDASFASDGDLLAFAEKEKILQRLFPRRRKAAAAAAVLLGGILLGGSLAEPAAKVTVPAVQPSPAVPAQEAGPAFWDLFASEVEALYGAGGIIEEYAFDAAAVPTNILGVKKCDPDILSDRIGSFPFFTQVHIPEISFEGYIPRFTVRYSARNLNAGEPSGGGNPYMVTTAVRDFCAENGFSLYAADLSGRPSFLICVDEGQFPGFLAKLRHFCGETGKKIQALNLTRDAIKKLFRVRLSLAADSIGGKAPLPDAHKMDEVFALKETADTGESTPAGEGVTAPVGKIQTGIGGTIVFVKSISGKISVEKKR